MPCGICGYSGHNARTCERNRRSTPRRNTSSGSSRRSQSTPRRCTNCRQPGHYKPTCTKPGGGAYTPPRTQPTRKRAYHCSNCNEPRHNITSCTKPGGGAYVAPQRSSTDRISRVLNFDNIYNDDAPTATSTSYQPATVPQPTCVHCGAFDHRINTCPAKAEADRLRREAAEARRLKAEFEREAEQLAQRLREDKRRQEEETARRQREEEARKRRLAEEEAERERRRKEDEARRAAEEADRQRRKLEDDQRRAKEEADRRRRLQEDEERRVKYEAEMERRRKDDETRRAVEEARLEELEKAQAEAALRLAAAKRHEEEQATARAERKREAEEAIGAALQGDCANHYDWEDLLDGTRNFSDDNIIGTGVSATVYRCQLSDGVYAVKKLARDATAIEVFNREGNALFEFAHPNIVRMFGAAYSDDSLCFVIELVDGQALDGLVADHAGFDWSQRVRVAYHTALALAFIHDAFDGKTMLHRDLKPHNILVTFDDNGGAIAKLADFGLSAFVEDDRTHYSTVHRAGTPGYSLTVPEYAQRSQFYPVSDVFCWAVVLLELLLGHLTGDSSFKPVKNHANRLVKDGQLGSYAAEHGGGWDQDVATALYELAVECLDDDYEYRPSAVTVADRICGLMKSLGLDFAGSSVPVCCEEECSQPVASILVPCMHAVFCDQHSAVVCPLEDCHCPVLSSLYPSVYWGYEGMSSA